jgi:hypothetical protein
MAETTRLGLPLVQAAQAQKHITVNSAFERLDALSHLLIASRQVTEPPISAADGLVYSVPTGASGAWTAQDGRLALRLNSGWDFADPATGWRAWIADEGASAIHDGTEWIAGAATVSASGAGMVHRVIEADHVVDGGSQSVTAPLIPSGAIVFGVTGRVLEALGGTAATFRVGIGGVSADRYGSGIGTGAGAWFRGVTSSPLAYYDDTSLTLGAEGGAFGGGAVRIAVHVAELTLPRP